MMTKSDIRQMIRQRKLEHPADESSFILQQLRADNHFTAAHTLLLYSALPDEVPTQQLLDELSQSEKTVLLPRVVSDTAMELRHYTDVGDLAQGAFGILEPTGAVFTDYAQIDVAVIPGMAFDREGHRLGRGRGYYDRMLALMPAVYKIGICFPWQLVDFIPTSKHDVMMDIVISGSERP